MVHSSGAPTVSYRALTMVIPFSGLLALKRAGFQVEVYYASETDGQATIICQANHSQAVTQLGDVTKITTDVASACCCPLLYAVVCVWVCMSVHDSAHSSGTSPRSPQTWRMHVVVRCCMRLSVCMSVHDSARSSGTSPRSPQTWRMHVDVRCCMRLSVCGCVCQ